MILEVMTMDNIPEPQGTYQTFKALEVLMPQDQGEFSEAEIAQNPNLASGILSVLLQLEHVGWVESRWEVGDPSELGRPRRRLYKLTGVGTSRARPLLQLLERINSILDKRIRDKGDNQ